jgi:hypothetical protein
MVGILMVSTLLVGCGNASKDDVCGKCTGTTKEACEAVYDGCKDDSDCIDALEDAVQC